MKKPVTRELLTSHICFNTTVNLFPARLLAVPAKRAFLNGHSRVQYLEGIVSPFQQHKNSVWDEGVGEREIPEPVD